MRWLSMLMLMLMVTVLGGVAVAAEKSATTVDNKGLESRYVDESDMTQVPRLLRKILVRAMAAANRGQHDEAIAELEEHLRNHPDQDHYQVRYRLGRSYDALERYEDARAQYRQAVTMEPRLAGAWFGLGHVAYNLQDYAASGEAFLKSFRTDIDPEPGTLYFAAAGYMLADDHAAAAPLLEMLCSGRWGEPRHDWFAQLAACAIALRQPELARPTLEAYLAADAANDEAWFLLYQFHVGFKQYRDAAVALTMVGFLRELTPREQQTLGDLYATVDVPALASRHYRAAMSGDADARDFERLVSALVAAHDLDGALATLQEGLAAASTPRLWSLLGDVHYMRRDYTGAAEAFDRVTELDPDNGRAWLMVGYCHLELGNRGLAIQHLVNAAKHDDEADLAQRLLVRARKLSSDT